MHSNLVFVDGGEDEEELDEACAEGEDARHQRGEHRVHVPGLRGDLPGDLVGADGLLVGLLAVAEVVAEVDEGEGDAEPHGAHGDHRAEGDGARGVLAPDEEVGEDAEREDDARVERGRDEGGPLPLLPLDRLVEAAGEVAADEPHELVEEDGGGEEGAARGRREHAQHGEEDGDEHHAEELDAGADERDEEARVGRRPEDVAVHQLPAGLLDALLHVVVHVVPGDVAPQGPDDDHSAKKMSSKVQYVSS